MPRSDTPPRGTGVRQGTRWRMAAAAGATATGATRPACPAGSAHGWEGSVVEHRSRRPLPPEQDLVALKQQAASLEQALGELNVRIQELEKSVAATSSTGKEDTMKVAVSATGPSLDAAVDPRFGRCSCVRARRDRRHELRGCREREQLARRRGGHPVRPVGGAEGRQGRPDRQLRPQRAPDTQRRRHRRGRRVAAAPSPRWSSASSRASSAPLLPRTSPATPAWAAERR